MEAVIFIGIPASGKTTFYLEHFAATHVHINLDTLKTRHREACLLDECLREQRSFVVDNTNVLASQRARYVSPARAAGYRICGYYFQTQLSEALQRNQLRIGKALIPEKGVLAKYHHLQPPQFEEGFDRLYTVSIRYDGKFVIDETGS
jgi:predicted kinase